MVHTRNMRELLAGSNGGFQVVDDPNALEAPQSDYEYEEQAEDAHEAPFGPRAGDEEEEAADDEEEDFEFEEFDEGLDEEVDDEDEEEFDDDEEDLDDFEDDDDEDDDDEE